jgi:hypothetical protein
LYDALKAGNYGAVQPYVAPSPNRAALYAAANAKSKTLLAIARTYDLGGGVSVLCDSTTATGTNLSALDNWARGNPSGSRVWVDNFGTRTTLTSAQFSALAQAALGYALSVYDPGLSSVLASIDAGTATTIADVASAPGWPT